MSIASSLGPEFWARGGNGVLMEYFVERISMATMAIEHVEIQLRDTPSVYESYLLSLDNENTRRTMKSCLDNIAWWISRGVTGSGAHIEWQNMTYQHALHIKALLIEKGLAPATVNKHLVALRRVLREAWRLNLMTYEDYQRVADISPINYQRQPVGQHVELDAVSAVLAKCYEDERPIGVRDGALLWVLFETGIRRAEAAGAQVGDYNPHEGELRVIGKGNKERTVPLHDAMGATNKWLELRGDAPGPLFLPFNRNGRMVWTPDNMSGTAVYQIVKKRCEQAGVDPFTPHDLRRTLVGDLLSDGVDISTVKQIVGHERVDTTARYDNRGGEVQHEAIRNRRQPNF